MWLRNSQAGPTKSKRAIQAFQQGKDFAFVRSLLSDIISRMCFEPIILEQIYSYLQPIIL